MREKEIEGEEHKLVIKREAIERNKVMKRETKRWREEQRCDKEKVIYKERNKVTE